MGRARGTKKDRGTGEPAPGRWPPELQDLQRRGGMSPDWHEATHGRSGGVGQAAKKNIDLEKILDRPHMRWRYEQVLDEAGVDQVLDRRLFYSFSVIFEASNPLQEEGAAEELQDFFDMLARHPKSFESIDRDLRTKTLERVADRLEEIADEPLPAQVKIIAKVRELVQQTVNEIRDGEVSAETQAALDEMGFDVDRASGVPAERSESTARIHKALSNALSVAELLSGDFIHNGDYVVAVDVLSRFELSVDGKEISYTKPQKDPDMRRVSWKRSITDREAIAPYWEIFKAACRGS